MPETVDGPEELEAGRLVFWPFGHADEMGWWRIYNADSLPEDVPRKPLADRSPYGGIGNGKSPSDPLSARRLSRRPAPLTTSAPRYAPGRR